MRIPITEPCPSFSNLKQTDRNMQFLFLLSAVLVISSAHVLERRQANQAGGNQAQRQQPPVWDALRVLRGGKDLTIEDMFNLIANAVPGQSYPNLAAIPESNIECSSFQQPGYYADDSAQSRCQVFHRCDPNGIRTSYLCPNGTLFNQITLICDWFFNVDCSVAAQFADYSNSRLAMQDAMLLDNQMEIAEITGAVPPSGGPAPAAAAPAAAPVRAAAARPAAGRPVAAVAAAVPVQPVAVAAVPVVPVVVATTRPRTSPRRQGAQQV